MSTVPLTFALISFVFAYLAINTPDKHGAMQTFNYLLVYVTVFFTGYLSYTFAASNEEPAGLLITWNNTYFAIIGLVFAYFLVMIINTVMSETRG